jgi:hypothetical protein
VFRRRGDRFRRWEQISLPRRAMRWRADVLHCPATGMPWWQPVPTVVTLHDTILWESEEEGPPDAFYLGRLLPSAYARCAAIVTISESSRRDILRIWPHLEEKLHVIPHGIGDAYLGSVDAPLPESLRGLGIAPPTCSTWAGTTGGSGSTGRSGCCGRWTTAARRWSRAASPGRLRSASAAPCRANGKPASSSPPSSPRPTCRLSIAMPRPSSTRPSTRGSGSRRSRRRPSARRCCSAP